MLKNISSLIVTLLMFCLLSVVATGCGDAATPSTIGNTSVVNTPFSQISSGATSPNNGSLNTGQTSSTIQQATFPSGLETNPSTTLNSTTLVTNSTTSFGILADTIIGNGKFLLWSPKGDAFISGVHSNGSYDFSSLELRRIDGTPIALLQDTNMNDNHQVSWASDGKTIATGNTQYGGVFTLWDGIGQKIANLSEAIAPFAWSPDGKILATNSYIKGKGESNGIKLWDKNGKLIYAIAEAAGSIAWSPDGKLLATSTGLYHPDGSLFVSESLFTKNPSDGRPIPMAWSPDGKILATGTGLYRSDGSLISTYAEPQKYFKYGLLWASDSKTLLTDNEYGTLALWDTQAKPIATLANASIAYGAEDVSFSTTWSPDGKTLVTGLNDSSDTLVLWNAKGERIATLAGHIKTISDKAWSPDGKMLVSASYDSTARLWTADGKLIKVLPNPDGIKDGIDSVAWSPDGKTLLAGTYIEPMAKFAILVWH